MKLRGRRSRRAAAVLLLAMSPITACSAPSARDPGAAPAGPWVAGTTTIAAAGTSVQLWYPAGQPSAAGAAPDTYDLRAWLPPAVASRVRPGQFTFTTGAYRGLPAAAGGPFPLVLFAHGLYSFRDQSTSLTAWLASWGYVVAAPDFPVHDLAAYFDYTAQGRPLPAGPGDDQVLAATEAAVTRLDDDPGGMFAGRISTRRVAVVGHSQGGIDAMPFASRPEVATYIALAAGFAGAHPALPAVPSLYLAAAMDRDIPPGLVRAVYDSAPAPKRLIVLPRAGHLAFTDLCLINRAGGGLAALARQVGGDPAAGAPFTARALDGCGPAYARAAASMAEVRRAVLGQLQTWLPAPRL